jgi:hypothetical protein
LYWNILGYNVFRMSVCLSTHTSVFLLCSTVGHHLIKTTIWVWRFVLTLTSLWPHIEVIKNMYMYYILITLPNTASDMSTFIPNLHTEECRYVPSACFHLSFLWHHNKPWIHLAQTYIYQENICFKGHMVCKTIHYKYSWSWFKHY